MADERCNPCEVNELQAWKCMMDSMVKFIQASTKLMNTFNDKATSQMALPDTNVLGSCPPCKFLDIPEKTLCPKECRSYSLETKKCKKCVAEEPEEVLCHAECKMCAPSRKPICDKCNPESKEESGSQTGEISSRKGSKLSEKVAEVDLDETLAAEEVNQEDKAATEGEAAPEEEPEPTPEEPPPETETETETEAETEPSPENIDEAVQKGGSQTKTSKLKVKDCGCQYKSAGSKTSLKSSDSCTCNEPKKEEEDCICEQKRLEEEQAKCNCNDDVQQLCSCPLSSAEKIDITDKMTQKLQMAQQEIDDLKRDLQQLQFAELTKHSNSAALYKEIMKENDFDQSYRGPASQRKICSDKNTCPSNLQYQMSSSSSRRVASANMPNYRDNSQYSPRMCPLSTADILNGTQSDSTSWQKPNPQIGKPGKYCNDNNNVCIKRNKQQRRPNSFNKGPYQTPKPYHIDYNSYQQPIGQPLVPLYTMYCTDTPYNDDLMCECPTRPQPYSSQVDVVYDQNSNWQQQDHQGYNGRKKFLNDNFCTDDESCDDNYNCGNQECDKVKAKRIY